MRKPSSRQAICCCLALLLFAALTCAANDPQPRELPLLQLVQGDWTYGEHVDANRVDTLPWQSPGFTKPFQFPWQSIVRVLYPRSPEHPAGDEDYSVYLVGGDILFGSLVDISEQELVLDVAGSGPLRLDRAIVCRLHRRRETIQLRPFGNELHGGAVPTTHRRDFGLPAHARIEFELTWQDSPQFDLELGDDFRAAFRLEIWEGQLVLVRQTDLMADMAVLQSLDAHPGRIQLQAFVDQIEGRLLVYSADGRELADLTVPATNPRPAGSIQLTSRLGGIRLEWIRVSPWDAMAPRSGGADQDRFHLVDGSIQSGRLVAFHPAEHEFVISDGTNERRIAENLIWSVDLHQVQPRQRCTLQGVTHSGQRISGNLVKIERNVLWLNSPGVHDAIAIPISSLQSLVATKDTPAVAPEIEEFVPVFPVGRLDSSSAVLYGRFIESVNEDDAALVWQPVQSQTASPWNPASGARIQYRNSLRPTSSRPISAADPNPLTSAENSRPILHLKSGDRISCRDLSIDESGLTLASSRIDADKIRHDRVLMVELAPEMSPLQVPWPKRERLMTLPRLQRFNPPTQLIQSVDGDCLRGRLASMDERRLQVEVLNDMKTIDRSSAARILWLQEEEGPSDVPSALTPSNRVAPWVSVLPRDGNCLSFTPSRLAGTILCGVSPLLGECRIDLRQVELLSLGQETAGWIAQVHDWKLVSAAEPISAKEGDPAEGKGSALVGKKAPDFTLDVLDMTRFRLSEHRDKIVVLDFWASWCEPCLRTMPQLEKIADEFRNEGVIVIAVNLEESPERIRATLDRLKLKPIVAMDRNGRVAERYEASSIPQTVIIDRQGQVARLFVGGGNGYADRLREALKQVSAESQPQPK